MYLGGDGERVAPDSLDGDMSATPTGESSPSRRLICASAWRIVSSAIAWASSAEAALAETSIVRAFFSFLADME